MEAIILAAAAVAVVVDAVTPGPTSPHEHTLRTNEFLYDSLNPFENASDEHGSALPAAQPKASVSRWPVSKRGRTTEEVDRLFGTIKQPHLDEEALSLWTKIVKRQVIFTNVVAFFFLLIVLSRLICIAGHSLNRHLKWGYEPGELATGYYPPNITDSVMISVGK